MKDLINDFINYNEAITKLSHQLSDAFEQGKDMPAPFSEALRATSFNPALGVGFAEALQLSNDSDYTDQYNLQDVRRLYESLMALQQASQDATVEAAHFEWTVMDDGERARQLIAQGISEAEEKINLLKEMLEEIKD